MSQSYDALLWKYQYTMALSLSPWIRQQFFDNEGSPLAGGFVTFYVAGSTSLLKNTYQDYLGATANENPVELDSSGIAKIFGAGMYDVTIADYQGNVIETVRGVDFGGGDSTLGTFVVVDNYDALRNLTQDYDVIYVLGRNTAFDGGQGIFQRTTLADSDDDGIVLVRGISTHYFRVLDDIIKPEWYGVQYSTPVDQSIYLLNALDASKTWNLPVLVTGSVFLSTKMTVKSGSVLNVTGALTGPTAGIEVHFATGSRFTGGKNCLANGINATFEAGVADALRLSWFTEGTDNSRWAKLVKATLVGYDVLVDIDTKINEDITVPAYLSVNFIGGSKIIVSGFTNIDIETLAYAGTAEIIHYQDISYVGTVKLGNGYCYLEWFGGVAGTALDTDNSIAFKAGMAQGNIYLISNADKFYNIPAGTYSNSNGLVMLGNYVPNNSTVNDLVPSTLRLAQGANISTGRMTLTGLKVIGSGSITATESTLTDVILASTVAYATGMSKINDSVAIDPNYLVVGGAGKIANTADANGTWTPVTTPINVNITSVTRGPKLYVLVGQNGLIETSPDGLTWTQRTSGITANLNTVKWISAVSKYIAVGDSGYVLSSVDGISWNATQTVITSVKSVAYFDGKYVIVGSNGNIYTSTDLLSWTQKVVTGLTGLLYSVDASDTLLTIVGYNGTIVTSADAVNFTTRLSPATGSLLSVKYYSDANIWLVTGTNGVILKSLNGVEYALVNTYADLTDAIYDQIKVNGQYVFAGGSGYVLTSFDLVKFNKTTAVNGVNNYGLVATESKILAIGDAGAISYSTDGVNYTAETPATAQNLNRIKKIGSNYFIVGNAGVYLVSVNGLDWTVKSAGTTDLYDIVANADNSLYVLVGADGFIATSTDANATVPLWSVTSPVVSTDINQIFFNSASINQKYVAIGANGRVLYSANGTTWNVNTYASNGILSNGTIKLIYGDAGLVLTSTDGISWSKQVSGTAQNLYAGAYDGTHFVLAGVSGTIVTSTDGITWTVQNSGTTETISSLAWNGTMFVGVGTAGLTIRSTDGLNWTPTITTSTITFHSVRWINSNWVAVGTYGVGGIIRTSPDGYTWTAQTAGTTETIYDIAWDGSKYVYVAGAGVIMYGAMGSWTAADSDGVTQALYGIYFDASGLLVAVGANGAMLTSSNGMKFNHLTTVVSNDLHSVVKIGSEYFINGTGFTILKSSELLIWKTYIRNPTDENLVGMFDGTNYAVVAQDTVLSITFNHLIYSKDGMVWLAVNNEQTQMTKVSKVNGLYTLYGYAGVAQIYTSSDITATSWNKNIINSNGATIASITVATINGNALIVYFGANGQAITGTSGNGLLTATKISLKNVISSIKIVNTEAGDVSVSDLYDISFIGRTTDTDISDFTGTLNDSVNRCNITFVQSVNIAKNINVSDTLFTNKSGKKLDVFKVASTVTSLVLNNCNINSAGSMLVYSENTALKIIIEGGVIVGGNDTALTNGYAKIYLNNVFDAVGEKVENISAYSLDGDVLESDLVTHMSSANLSADLTHWYHTQKGNMVVDAGAIKINTATVLSSDIDSSSALRYRWGGTTALRFLKNFGGRIKTTIQFPAGSADAQANTKVKAQLYIPEYTVTCYDYDTLVYTGKVNNSYLVGKTVSMGSSVDSAKLINYTNVWSGRQDMLYGAFIFGARSDVYGKNGIVDIYGDVSFKPADHSVLLGQDYQMADSFGSPVISGDVSHEAYIVLTSAEDVILPVGTTIKVELELSIPATLPIFNRFYNVDNDYSLDTVTGIEKVYLHYKGLEDNTFKVAIVKNALSKTKNEKEYLSVTDATSYNSQTQVTSYYQVPDSYKWYREPVPGYPVGDEYCYRQYLQYVDPKTLLEFAQDNIDYDLEITINGLYNSTMAAKAFGGAQSSSVGTNNVTVSATSGVVGGIYFIHSIWKHLRLKNMSFFDQIDKVITKRYYNPL